jgi:hypothetical protein
MPIDNISITIEPVAVRPAVAFAMIGCGRTRGYELLGTGELQSFLDGNSRRTIDMDMLAWLRAHWTGIQDELISRIDTDYGCYEGRTFKAAKFAEWLARANIPWPRLESGHLDLSDDAFREAARSHPMVAPLREVCIGGPTSVCAACMMQRKRVHLSD